MVKIGLISLGCPKNQVDSELMIGKLIDRPDILLVEDFNEAEVIIINTCGFIQDAKEESIDTIIEAGRLKEEGSCRALIVTGCLTQRYQDELIEEMPEIDGILGTGNFDEISEVIDEVLAGKRVSEIGDASFNYKADLPRKITDSHYAYVKIAEGCSNNCTYCSIPRIRGPQKSRPIEDIVKEVNNLVKMGIKEVILIAQDTTRYGYDLYNQPRLVELLERLLTIEKLKWIRLMYSYPENIDERLIELIASEKRICNYLDLPVQHSSNKIRKMMNRRATREDLLKLIDNIRSQIPDIALRTSLIVGFPGESEEDFKDLLDFIREVEFERLGVFKYSREEGTPAYDFPGQISAEIKEERYQKVMELQQEIALKKNQELIGKKMEIIIDEIDEDNILARSQFDAPEIDNQIYLHGDNLEQGDMLICKINEAYEYDLIGEKIYESA